MTKFAAAIKIGWLAGQIIGWALFGSVAAGGEPFRVEPRPMTVPLPTEPATNPPPADHAGKAAVGIDPPTGHDSQHAPADPRPKIFVHSVHRREVDNRPPLCGPCEKFADWWVMNCDTFPLNIEPVEYESFDALPQWIRERGVPLAHFASETSPTGWASLTWNSETMVANWTTANPGARLRIAASRGAGASPFDQVQKFTGAGGSFTFKPDQPINAALDDRTSIRYPSIQGRYTVENGVVRLKLEAPLPVGNYRKFLNFGFQITGAVGPENLTPTTADVTIETNRGPQRITVTMEPVK